MTAPMPSWQNANDLAAHLAAGRSADDLLRLLTPEGQQAAIVATLAAHAQMISNQEVQMAATDDKVAELSSKLDVVSGNVTNIISDVDNLQAEVERLQAELEAQDPALAAKLQPLVDKIQGLSDTTKTLPGPRAGSRRRPRPGSERLIPGHRRRRCSLHTPGSGEPGGPFLSSSWTIRCRSSTSWTRCRTTRTTNRSRRSTSCRSRRTTAGRCRLPRRSGRP
jgi:uncharacterized small protein (DUF1192 family)